jgi:hypothetical protein
MAQKGVPVSFRLLPEIKAALDKAAKDDHRSLSSLLDKMVSEWLKDAGYLPK